MQSNFAKQTPIKSHKRHSSQVQQNQYQSTSHRQSTGSNQPNSGHLQAVQQAVFVEPGHYQKHQPNHRVNQSVQLNIESDLNFSQHSVQDPSKHAKQLSKASIKKSDLKLLQKYCEQNGLDMSKISENQYLLDKVLQIQTGINSSTANNQGHATSKSLNKSTNAPNYANQQSQGSGLRHPMNTPAHFAVTVKNGSQGKLQNSSSVTGFQPQMHHYAQFQNQAMYEQVQLHTSKSSTNELARIQQQLKAKHKDQFHNGKFIRKQSPLTSLEAVKKIYDKNTGVSASNGYFTKHLSPQKHSTGNKTPSVIQNLVYKTSKNQQRKSSQAYLKNSHGVVKQGSASQLSDYSAEAITTGNPPKTNPHHAHSSVKHSQRSHRPSSSLEHQQTTNHDSGVGSINQNSIISQRDDPIFNDGQHNVGYQSSKAAMQSRRKHGSVDNYVQNDNSSSKFIQSSSQKRLQQQQHGQGYVQPQIDKRSSLTKVSSQLPHMYQKIRQKGYTSNVSGSTRISERAIQPSSQPQTIQTSQRTSDSKPKPQPSIASSVNQNSYHNQAQQRSQYANEPAQHSSAASGKHGTLPQQNRNSSRQKQRTTGHNESTEHVSYEAKLNANDSQIQQSMYRPGTNQSQYNSILLAHSQAKGMTNEQRVSSNIIVYSSKRAKSKNSYQSLQNTLDHKGSQQPVQQSAPQGSGALIHSRKSSVGHLQQKNHIQVTPGPSQGLKKSGILTAAQNSPKSSLLSNRHPVADKRHAQPQRKSVPQNLLYQPNNKNKSLNTGTPVQNFANREEAHRMQSEANSAQTHARVNQQSPMDEEYLLLLQQQQSRISLNADDSIEQMNRRLVNPIMDGGTGSKGAELIQKVGSKELFKKHQDLQNDISTHSAHSNYSGVQSQVNQKMASKTPNLKKDQLVYLANNSNHYTGLDSGHFQMPNSSHTTTNTVSGKNTPKQPWLKVQKNQGSSNLLKQQPQLTHMHVHGGYYSASSQKVINLSQHMAQSNSQPQLKPHVNQNQVSQSLHVSGCKDAGHSNQQKYYQGKLRKTSSVEAVIAPNAPNANDLSQRYEETVSGAVQVSQSQMKGPKRYEANSKIQKKVSVSNFEKRSSSVSNVESKQQSNIAKSILTAELRAKKSDTKVAESHASRETKKNRLRHGSQSSHLSASNLVSMSKEDKRSTHYHKKSISKPQHGKAPEDALFDMHIKDPTAGHHNQPQPHIHHNSKTPVIHKHLKKNASQPQLPEYSVRRGHDESTRIQKADSGESRRLRKSSSTGPKRQTRFEQPMPVADPEPIPTSIEGIQRDLDFDDKPLITEEEEHEIRQVASDINEKAFYGKLLKTKQALGKEGDFKRLSPRSQEIGYVMKKVTEAFRLTRQPPTTDMSFYRIGKMLGRGAFGKVNLAMHKLVRKLVALKSLNKEVLTDEAHKAKLMKEVNLLLKMRHNHVVKIYETIETEKHIIIVMELCAGGDLLNYVRKRRKLKEPFAQKIFKQIVDGLHYTHSKLIAHRDIKLDNILLDGKGNVKIADFGVSRQIHEGQTMREQCGTPAYIAPEIIRNKGYGLNVDLWSAGVVLFAMLYGTVPFKAQSMEELHDLILKGKYMLKEDISVEARDLLRGLLEIDPKKRLTIRQIYKHPWLKNMDMSVQLFNEEERDLIKKEYTYNDQSRYNRNENEEPVDCFTEHNFESQYSTLKNHSSKSVILAPFNSTMSDQDGSLEEMNSLIENNLLDKKRVLRFAKKCREVDRQYEFNNNGQLDNGVYHKVVANNSFEQENNFEETHGIEIEQKLTDSYTRYKREKAAKQEERPISASGDTVLSMDLQPQGSPNLGAKQLDFHKITKLTQFGYPEEYVMTAMKQMQPNYCTAGYYLLEMDQNYC